MNSLLRACESDTCTVASVGETEQHYKDFTKGGGQCLSSSTHGGYSSQLLAEQGGAGSGSAG